MKKLLSLICALALLASVLVIAPAAAADEPTTITWLHQAWDVSGLDHWYDALWVKELEARLNVKFEFISVNSTDNYDNVVNLNISGGDYPDIISWNWSNYSGGIEAAIEDGLVQSFPMSELQEKVPNYYNLIANNEYINRALVLTDGSIAAFCHVEESTARNAYSGYAIRKDWLDRLNLEVPKTIDELHDALVAFKEQDANGNGDPNDEIPMSDRVTLNLIKELGSAWGLIYNYPQLDPETGKVTYWTEINDGKNFRDFAMTMRQWYAEGLIDPSFTSNTQTEINSQVTSDIQGFWHTNTNRFPGYYTLLKDTVASYADSSAVKLEPLPRFPYVYAEGADAKRYTQAVNLKNWAAAAEGNAITSAAVKEGKVDKILELFNYMYSEEGTTLISWGVEGVSFDYDADGNKVWKEVVLNNEGGLSSDTVMQYCIPTRGEFPKIMDLEAWMTVDCSHEDGQRELEYNYSADKDLIIPNILLTGEDAETYTMIMNDVNTSIAETFLSVVIGNKDEAAIDELFNTIDRMGIEKAIEIYSRVYENYLNKEIVK
ncbi:MAG: extracellular solute-binding protein [Clostridia bacterium]|nr:extracellular solute-binding protein [Clostridia bacterium]